MGFEQLAELKKQLAAARREAAPAAKSGAKPASKDAARPAKEASKPAAKDASKPGARPARKPAPPRRAAPAAAPGARPAAEARPAVDAKPVDPVVKSIGRLQKRFPVAFPKNPAPKLPLKVGIFEDLMVHAKELSLSEAELRDAIKTWCRGSRYWKCLVEGAARVDLTGAEAGKVTAQEASGAQRLQAHRAGKGAPKTAGAANANATGEAATEVGAQATAEAATTQAEAPNAPAGAEGVPEAAAASQAGVADKRQAGAADTTVDDREATHGASHEAATEPASAPATREA
ncbi:ProQ/FinO family protein [Paraburkholderia aromaticivorans]|uniref:ProQ/FinO family protein n=1 Tax=Paraburkholderia aromaticivorans TaxID=2026199 RepID=UPI0038B6EC77